MKKLLLILLCLPLLFSSCADKKRLELDFKIGDSNKEWKGKLLNYSNNDYVIDLEEASLNYSFNDLKFPIPVELNFNNLLYHKDDLLNEDLIQINVHFNTNHIYHYKPNSFSDFLKRNYGFSNKNEIIKWNERVRKKEINFFTGELMGSKSEQKLLDEHTSILQYFIINELDRSIEWTSKNYHYTMYHHSLSKSINITIKDNNFENTLENIKKKLSSSYTADDYASIDFLTPTIIKDSFFEEVSFSFLVNRYNGSFDDRRTVKLKLDLIFMDEFNDVVHTEKNQVIDLGFGLANSYSQTIRRIAKFKRSNITHYKIEAKLKTVILSDGTVISN